jgi:hypothetical protein
MMGAITILVGVAIGQEGIEQAPPEVDSGQLLDMINSVQPPSWDPLGGPGPAAVPAPQLDPSNLSLVVAQTQEVHEEIVDLLEQMRRLQDIQVTVETPFRTVNDSFFEQFGVDWNLNFKGVPVSFGRSSKTVQPTTGPSSRLASPQFGGFDPSAGMRTGWAINHRNWDGGINLFAGQGYRQSAVTQSPKVTMFPGHPAYVSDTSQSPFVISVIPVVGSAAFQAPPGPYLMPDRSYAMLGPIPVLEKNRPNPRLQEMCRQAAQRKQQEAKEKAEMFRRVEDPNVPRVIHIPKEAAEREAAEKTSAEKKMARERGDLDLAGPAPVGDGEVGARGLAAAQQSSAGRAVPSVAEAKRMHEAEQASGNGDARLWYERGLTAEEGGKPHVAKIYYEMALKRATGPLRDEIQARLQKVSSPGVQ